MDMESAEKCWAYADARRGIFRQRKKKRQYQGAKQEARTDRFKRESSWKDSVGQRGIGWQSKGSSNREQTRKREAKQTGERIERHESGREVLWTYADARRGILR